LNIKRGKNTIETSKWKIKNTPQIQHERVWLEAKKALRNFKLTNTIHDMNEKLHNNYGCDPCHAVCRLHISYIKFDWRRA